MKSLHSMGQKKNMYGASNGREGEGMYSQLFPRKHI